MKKSPDWSNYKNFKIPSNITETIIDLRTIMGNTMELNIIEIKLGNVDCAVVTIEAMISTDAMAKLVFRPLMQFKVDKEKPEESIFHFCTNKSIMANDRKVLSNYGEMVQLLYSGFAVILIDNIPRSVAYGIQGYDKRSISQPTAERNIMGSQEAFTETIRTNISLVRRRLKDPALRFEMMQIGVKSATDVCLVYMADKTPPEIVDRIRKKLKKISLDTVVAGGYIKPFLEEKGSQNLFTSITSTERPDVFTMRMNEGKVGIIVDGTPFSIVCPTLFADNFSSIDDYCSKGYFATYLRWIRYLAFFFAIAFPGFCVAITNFHPEMMTIKLLLNLSASEQTTPTPLFFEILIIMTLLELMREASIRLPNAVGSAVSIVGGLVIGDAAVKSGIISSPMLIIVGLTATASFAIPSLNQQSSVLRLTFIFAGGSAGFLGIAICFLMITANICAMDEFNIPYTTPISPFSLKHIKDVISRKTFRKMAKDHITIENYVENSNK